MTKKRHLNPKRLVEVSPAVLARVPNSAQRVFADHTNGWMVSVDDWDGTDGTPWEGSLRVHVTQNSGSRPEHWNDPKYRANDITWDELNAIKQHFWPNRIAIEIYPPKNRSVDVAAIRWLWVLPEGAELPFNLEANSTILK